MVQIYRFIFVFLYIQLSSTLQTDQVKIISRGELYNSNTAASYSIDSITMFNIDTLSITKSNFRTTFTGWIQTGSTANLNKYESKIQIFNQNSVNEKLFFFGNNSTHFILRQDISSSSFRCVCELVHKLSSSYRFVASIQQNTGGLQLSLVLQLSDGTIQYCKKTDNNQINISTKTFLLAIQVQKPIDSYIYSSEKMGELTLIQNYAFARDISNSNLQEEKFLLGYNPAGLSLFYFKFSYEQRDCNCIVDSSENQIQGMASKSFGVLESTAAGGYFIYTFTQNQEFQFSKSQLRFGQPMDNFYNSLNINNQSNSYEFMSLLFSFWVQYDPNIQSFQVLSYSFPSNSIYFKIKKNSSTFQLVLIYSSTEYVLASSLNPNQYYHISILINFVYTDLYINGVFQSQTQINLSTLFTQETSRGTIKLGGENLPISSTGKLSQVRMYSSSSILSNQSSVVESLIANCFTLVQEREKYTCILCKTGYLLNDQGQCVSGCNSSSENQLTSVRYCAPKCSYRCKTCSADDPLTCTSCNTNRVLKGTTCLCSNGTFEDYQQKGCNSVKKLTKGFEIAQFTFKGQSSLIINFKQTFSTAPNVLFSVLGYSVSNGSFGQFEVKATSITSTSMTVTPGLSGSFYLHVQYFAYETSQYFYSGVLGSFGLLGSSGNYPLPSLGSYYTGKNKSLFNTHIFLGGYLCNPILILLQPGICQLNISVGADKKSVDVQINSLLLSKSPTIYYLITPPEITSFNLANTYSSSSIFKNLSVLEKYQLTQIPLTPLNSVLSLSNPRSFDVLYSIINFDLYQDNFKYMKYQPNEIGVSSSGIVNQNAEIFFNSKNINSFGIQATVIFEQFIDSVCGVKDFYTRTCLFCQNFGYDPSNGCVSCLNTFILDGSGNCIVPNGKYYDSVTNSNKPCDQSCDQCTNASTCTVCKGQLVFGSSGLCTCSLSNQWFDSNGSCFPCDLSCNSCNNSSSCLTCKTGLTQNPSTQLCECPIGQWLDNSTVTCQQCFFVCYTCASYMNLSSQNCNSCKAGRVLDNGTCKCSSNDQRLYQDELRCSQDGQAVLNAIISNDYLNISIDFGINITPLFTNTSPSYSLCQQLFDQQTLTLLGSGVQCSISSSYINLVLDGTARIIEGNSIYFLPNVLKYDYNQMAISTFYRNQVLMVGAPIQSQVLLGDYNITQNYCSKQNISVKSITNDGKRGVQFLQWKIVNISPSDNKVLKSLQSVIDEANLNQSQQIDVFLPMVLENTSISIQMSFNLWIGQSGVLNASILIERKKILRVSHIFTSPSPFYVYKSLQVLHSISCEMCDETGKIYKIPEPLSITIKNTLLGVDNSFTSFTGNEITTQIAPYSMISGNTYDLKAHFVVESDPTVVKDDDVDIYITPSEIAVKILGGSRYASYKNQFYVKGLFKDYEEQNPTASTTNSGIAITWKCTNIANQVPCVDSKGNILTLQSGVDKILIEKYTFSPYTVAQFEVQGTKTRQDGTNTFTRKGSDKIIVFITEMDIPILEVLLPEELIIDPTINPNQLVHAEMVYDPSVNIDYLYYSGAILYKNEVVGVIKFDYSKIRFQVWNYFNSYTPDEVEIQVRFSVYNPEYIFPSLSTLTFKLNFPPSNCILNINSNSGYSLVDLFQISFDNCNDTDSPINYKFFYYNLNNEYTFELQNNLLIQREQLSDTNEDNQIETYLPGGKITILAQAIDSRGAISNSTLTVDIKYKDFNPNEFLIFINDFIQNVQILSPEIYILNLNLLSQDILNRESSYPTITQQLTEKKILIIKELQFASQQILSISYFYQLATQTVSKLLSSKLSLQSADQSAQMKLISDNLQKISQRCVSSEISQDKYEKCVEDIYLTFNWIDSLSLISKSSNPALNLEYIKQTEKIGNMLNSQAIPNENAVIFQGQNMHIKSQKITEKNLFNFTKMNNEQYQSRRRVLQDATNNTSSVNQTAIFDASYKLYNVNFYQDETSFKEYTTQVLNATNQSAWMFPVINPSIVDTDTKESYSPTNGVLHYFDIVNKNTNLTCFAQNDKKEWSKNTCATRFNNKTQQIQCVCPDLTPTTVINDISDLFDNNQNLDTVFSNQGIANLASFDNFYEYLVFWVVLGQTVIFICLIFYGMKLDKEFLFDSIPLPLRKISHQSKRSSISRIFPQNNAPSTTNKNNNNQTNIQTTFTISEEDEIKGVEESPMKPKRTPNQNNIQMFKLDGIYDEKEQDEKQNEQENDETQGQSKKTINVNKEGSSITNKNYNDNPFNQQISLSSHFIKFNRRRSVRVSEKAQEKDVQLMKDSSTQPPSNIMISSKNGSNEKKESMQITDLKLTTDSDNNIFSMKISNAKVPSIVKMCDLKDYDTPMSCINQKSYQNKIPSLSTLPDCQSEDAENDKQKNQNTPPNFKAYASPQSVKPKFVRKNKRDKAIRISYEISEQEKEKLTIISKFKYYVYFHEFISIFLVFRYEISRAVRFVMFYLRYEHTLAISILFGINKSLIQTIFVSLASSISILVLSVFLENLLSAKNFVKKIGVLISIFIAAFYAYIILAIVSGDKPNQSNKFIWTYVQFLITDILVVQTLTAFLFGIFAKTVVTKARNEQDFFQKLFNLLKLNLIISALLK